jgi:hypothetical protein
MLPKKLKELAKKERVNGGNQGSMPNVLAFSAHGHFGELPDTSTSKIFKFLKLCSDIKGHNRFYNAPYKEGIPP